MPKTETYTVKLEPETKQQWQKLIGEIKEEQSLDAIGEVYPVLIDIISTRDKKISTDLSSYIDSIRMNLNAILSNVMAIDDVYKSSMENNERKLEEAKKGLVRQLENASQTNKEIEQELKKTKSELEQANETIEKQRAEIEKLKDNTLLREGVSELFKKFEDLGLLSELKNKISEDKK